MSDIFQNSQEENKIWTATSDNIAKAASILKNGGLIALPTETVYGLGADAENELAVQKIFSAKGRPADHPLIVHLAEVDLISRFAKDIPEIAWKLMEAFWPGPLTIILKKQSYINSLVSGGQDTIGLRIPKHPVAQQLLQEFGSGVAAPSANRFGKISPTSAQHVFQELGNRIDGILDGGSCQVGLESTILDLSREKAYFLRPGDISINDIKGVIGYEPGGKSKEAPRVSGNLESHYAPTTKMIIMSTKEMASSPLVQNKSVVCLTYSRSFQTPNDHAFLLPNEPKEYGALLYAKLREADQGQYSQIILELPPHSPAWEAVHDRIARAAHPSGH